MIDKHDFVCYYKLGIVTMHVQCGISFTKNTIQNISKSVYTFPGCERVYVC